MATLPTHNPTYIASYSVEVGVYNSSSSAYDILMSFDNLAAQKFPISYMIPSDARLYYTRVDSLSLSGMRNTLGFKYLSPQNPGELQKLTDIAFTEGCVPQLTHTDAHTVCPRL